MTTGTVADRVGILMVLKMRFELGGSGFSTCEICGSGGSRAIAGDAVATRAIAAPYRLNLAIGRVRLDVPQLTPRTRCSASLK